MLRSKRKHKWTIEERVRTVIPSRWKIVLYFDENEEKLCDETLKSFRKTYDHEYRKGRK